MRLNTVTYRAIITIGQASDLIVVDAYNLDTGGRFVGFEFTRKSSSISNDGISMPGSGEATFTEELRCLEKAFDTTELPREREVEFIQEKLQEAYGASATIEVSRVE